ncbi:PXPV repeat-containing protein [Hyphomicrobium sp. 1Nfss2.1]|uniref:hypothetical protein n=1 Tax=Hyphomicrobium sp. 1Nfss2.1 TaxID=3413936 RepID=UPI003C7B3F39
MRFGSLLAVIGIAGTIGLAGAAPAEAQWCRAPRGVACGPAPVSHFIYYPRYSNVYYWATLVPYPGAYPYMARGYYDRYYRPYGQYARRFWQPRRARVAPVAVAYPVAAPPPGCCAEGPIK